MQYPWSQALILLPCLMALMLLAQWILGMLGRRGHVDLIWTLLIGLQALIYAVSGAGWEPRRWLVLALAGLWALRLTLHLGRRLGRDGEDGRYRAMEKAAGDRRTIVFLGFFQGQALAAWIFALPFFVLVQDTTPAWRPWEWVALILWALSMGGVRLADRQLDRWRKDPVHRGLTCRGGLWAWSRHPNYFFESLVWSAYAVAAIGTEGLWINLAIALLMLLMITKVSGIPFAEQQALRSRGEEYRDYQASTSAFFPIPPRHVHRHPSR